MLFAVPASVPVGKKSAKFFNLLGQRHKSSVLFDCMRNLTRVVHCIYLIMTLSTAFRMLCAQYRIVFLTELSCERQSEWLCIYYKWLGLLEVSNSFTQSLGTLSEWWGSEVMKGVKWAIRYSCMCTWPGRWCTLVCTQWDCVVFRVSTTFCEPATKCLWLVQTGICAVNLRRLRCKSARWLRSIILRVNEKA